MTNKIANLADKSTAYSAKIAGAFAGIGSSIREVTRLVENLNKKFKDVYKRQVLSLKELIRKLAMNIL